MVTNDLGEMELSRKDVVADATEVGKLRVCDFSVCLCVRALKEEPLVLSTPNFVNIQFMVGASPAPILLR